MTSRAFRVVEMFEEAVAEYAGAKYGVATDSCTTAIFLSLLRCNIGGTLVSTPARTYISVPNAIKRAGGRVELTGEEWVGAYVLGGTSVTDSALRMRRGMFTDGFYCVSFHMRKHIKIGRGGMILTDNAVAADWFRRMRFDGRNGSVSFLYIDSGAYGPGHSKTRTWTHGTCADCGGKYEFYVDGVLVDEAEYRASFTTPVSDDTEGSR